MNVLLILVPLALLLGLIFVGLFFLSVKGNQFNDLDSPPLKMLMDDEIDVDQSNNQSNIGQNNQECEDRYDQEQ